MNMRFAAFFKFRSFLLVMVLMLASVTAFATHFRYGNITWQRVSGNPYQVKFKVTQAWRRTAFVNSSGIVVGSTVSTSNFTTGAGDSTKVNLKVTEVNLAEDWFYGEWTYTKTYPSVTANYEASFYNCCRILPLLNNSNATVYVRTSVQINGNNDAPVSNIPPFISLPTDTNYVSYQIPAIDPNGDALTYSFTQQGQFGTPSVQPDSLRISSTGLLTWSTKNKAPGSIYNTSVKITDSKGAFVTVDFLIRIVGKSVPSSFDYTTTPPNGSTIQTQPGDSIAFQIKASDVDSGDTAKLIVAGLPPGATFNTSGTNPVTGNFGWKPDSTQEGVYLVNITAQDDAGVQNSTTVYFNVSYKPRFDIPTTPGNNSVFVITPGDSVEHPVKTYHPDSFNRVVLSIASGQKAGMNFTPSLPTLALNPAKTDFKWIPIANDWGINKVVYKVRDTFRNEVAYDTIFYAVDNAPVITSTPRLSATAGTPYTYVLSATDMDIPYGDSIFVEEKTLPSFLSITDNHNGTWTITGTPDASHIGAHSIMFEVADKVNHFGGTHVSNDVQTFSLTVAPAIQLSGNVTNATIYGVNNGAIDITATGGSGVYTYNWANNVNTEDRNNLVAGSYTVTVADTNGATATGTYTVTQPAQLTASANVANATIYGVNNGNINVSVAGGVGSYTYNWSNNATTEDLSGIGAGAYTVIVTDANGATYTATYNVVQPAQLAVTGSVTNATIFGTNTGAINITVTGGVNPYTYSWSNNSTIEDLTGLKAASYTVTVTDANGATATDTYIVNQPTQLTASANVTNVTINGANNGAINVTVNGGVGPYTYSWSNNSTGEDLTSLGAGNYTVTITDANGATFTATYSISQPPVLLATGNVSHAANNVNNGSIDITVTGGAGPYTYAWSNGATTEDLNNLAAGTYTVKVTDANGAVKTYSYIVKQIVPLNGAIAVSPVTMVSGQAPYTIYLGYGSQSVTLSGSAVGGTPGYTYSWSPANGISNPNAAAINVAPNTTTTYTLTIKDADNATKVVTRTIYVVDVRCSNNKIKVCHIPPGNSGNPQQLCLPASAIPAHLAHGDYLGDCLEAYGNTTNVTCNSVNSGSINLTVTGGVAPYTYSWSNNATTQDVTGLSAGTYTVTITAANGRTITESFCITQPNEIKLNAVVNNACGGSGNASINLSVSGGCAPYSYKWNNNTTSQDRSNLSAGTYTVVVTDAKGCTASGSYTITQPSAINITASVTNVTCNDGNDGAINITVTGGNSPYEYSWNNGYNCYNNNNVTTEDCNNLGTGAYTVQVTDDNGCKKTATFTLTEPTAIIGSISVSPNATVNNGKPYTIYKGYGTQSVTLSANATGGNSGYTYQWSGGSLNNQTSASVTVSPISTTTYTLKITDSKGCTKTVTRKVYVEDVRCGNGNNNNKIRVCHKGNEICIDASGVPAHLAHGCYVGECNDDEDERGGRCSKPGEAGTENENESTESLSLLTATSVKVYPNPTTGIFTLELPIGTEKAQIVVTDVTGRMIQYKDVKNEQYVRFELGNVAKGTYMIQVKVGNELYRSKLSVQ